MNNDNFQVINQVCGWIESDRIKKLEEEVEQLRGLVLFDWKIAHADSADIEIVVTSQSNKFKCIQSYYLLDSRCDRQDEKRHSPVYRPYVPKHTIYIRILCPWRSILRVNTSP